MWSAGSKPPGRGKGGWQKNKLPTDHFPLVLFLFLFFKLKYNSCMKSAHILSLHGSIAFYLFLYTRVITT